MERKFESMQGQAGMMLLEALIAILVFSVGILALVGMQAMAINQSSDARYRSEASLLANELIAQMWVSDRTPAALQANFNTGGALYAPWFLRVQGLLPGVVAATATAPTVVVSADGVATITVAWRAPNEPAGTAAHSYVVVAQVR